LAHPAGAIILADGDAPSRVRLDAAWPGWADGIDLVVAADGGARHAENLQLRIDVWVGDGDSVDEALLARLEAAGVEIRRVPVDKDETDAELGLRTALAAGSQRVVILGALGGRRLDHALANVALLEQPALATVDAVLFDAQATRVSLLAGPGARDLAGTEGDLVSLIPRGATAHGVTTRNLRYPLRGEDLELGRTRGVSNVRTSAVARVSLESGRLLVIETPATVGR
jgi:thiamine pyrophosphokinase